MERDSHKEELPPPTQEEKAVIRSFLYQCIHPEFEISRDRYGVRLAICLCCGDSEVIEDSDGGEAIAEMWRRRTPRPGTHEVVARAAWAEAGRKGWDTSVNARNGSWVCTVRNAERSAKSAAHPTLARAIVDVLAQVADR